MSAQRPRHAHPTPAAAALPALLWLSVANLAATATDVAAAARNVVGYDTAIAVGFDGLPVISYRDATAGALKVAKCANADCTGVSTITVVDDPGNDVGHQTDIAIGNDGLPVISYGDFTAGALKVARCANAACTGAATITLVDGPPRLVGLDTSIVIGADGLPVVSHLDSTAFALRISHCANAACTGVATSTTVDDTASNVGRYTAIALGADGWPVISYRDDTARALKVAKCANVACTGTVTISTVDATADVGRFSSIAIGNDGRPVISYADYDAGSLKVAHCANAACTGTATLTTVDNTTNLVGATSIAVGIDALPVIGYGDVMAGVLKVAKCANFACTGASTITVVDDPVNRVGSFVSIAIGDNGRPVMSYHDATAGALKVAKCANGACTGAATITTVDGPLFADGFEPLPP